MNTYTKLFWVRSGYSVSDDINEYIENCNSCGDRIRITTMTTITCGYNIFVLVAFEKMEE